MSGEPTPAASAAERLGRRLVDGAAVLDLPPPGWVVDDMVPAGGLVMPYGPPKAGKSLVAIDLALSVATGRPWAGNQVKRGNVLYVAAEGVGGLAARVAAWLAHRDRDDLPMLDPAIELACMFWLTAPVNLSDPVDVAALVELTTPSGARGHVWPTLIVLDTLARCAVGADENSARDMGAVVAGLDWLRAATGAAVVVVHHAGKDTGKGARGSSALLGAVDAAYEITGDGKAVTMRCTAMKDAAMPRAITFRMVPAAASVALDAYDAAYAVPPSVEDVLSTLVEIDTGEGVSATVWHKASGCPERTFYRARKWLVDSGRVRHEGRRYFVAVAAAQ